MLTVISPRLKWQEWAADNSSPCRQVGRKRITILILSLPTQFLQKRRKHGCLWTDEQRRKLISKRQEQRRIIIILFLKITFCKHEASDELGKFEIYETHAHFTTFRDSITYPRKHKDVWLNRENLPLVLNFTGWIYLKLLTILKKHQGIRLMSKCIALGLNFTGWICMKL